MQAHEEEVDLRPYIVGLRRDLWLGLFLIVVSMGGMFGYSYMVPKVYVSEAFWIGETAQQNGNLSALASLAGLAPTTNQQDNEAAYPAIVKSPIYLDGIIGRAYHLRGLPKPVSLGQALGIADQMSHEWIPNEEFRMQILRNTLSSSLSYKKDGSIHKIKVEAKDPVLAQELCAAALEQLRWFNEKKRKTKAMRQMEFLEARLGEYQQKLDVAEEELREFQESNLFRGSPELSLTQQRLSREVEVNASLVSEFRKQLELSRIDVAKEQPAIDPIQSPTIALDKDRPKRKMFVLGGLGLGLLLAVFASLLRTTWVLRRQEQLKSN
jgi:uncharacterized protein involved in exopolysaccharide biosynthesis